MALAAAPEKVALKPARDVLQEQAAADAEVAAGFEKVDTSPTAPELSAQGNRPLVQSFNVSNPHDRPEDVRLTIQPMSIPSTWKLSVVNAEQVGTVAQASPQGGSAAGAPPVPQPQFPIHEVTSGKEYVVTLPPKQQIKVASVLVPVGEVGANTTARWAVEGKIGNEVIGTMVHEMNVPYIISDMKLPAAGSKEEMEEGPPTAPKGRSPYLIAIAAAAAAVVIFVLFFLLRRRKGAAAA